MSKRSQYYEQLLGKSGGKSWLKNISYSYLPFSSSNNKDDSLTMSYTLLAILPC